MDRYLFVVCSQGFPISLHFYSGSDNVLAAAAQCLDSRIRMASVKPGPMPDFSCQVWQYITHDEMKKLITVF